MKFYSHKKSGGGGGGCTTSLSKFEVVLTQELEVSFFKRGMRKVLPCLTREGGGGGRKQL